MFIESGSIGADMVGNRFVCRLADKDANRLPEIVRLTITLFECPWLEHYLNVLYDIVDYYIQYNHSILFQIATQAMENSGKSLGKLKLKR